MIQKQEVPPVAVLGPHGKLWDGILSITVKMSGLHEKIKKTALELGEYIYQVEQILSNATSDERKEFKLPSFTVYMRDYVSEQCGFSERQAYRYYDAWKESLASGLTEETVRALAPTILKEEKTRKAVLRAIEETPELAAKLNEAQGDTKALKQIAKSAEVRDIVQSAKPQALPSRWERVKGFIVDRYANVFKKNEPDTANTALTELVKAFNMACEELGIADKVEVSVIGEFEEESTESLKERVATLTAAQHARPVAHARA